ncbi:MULTISPECIES: GDCCVxC domain-containing (seleno)protein [unclassified Myroides]|uniref:GDCCVxC domain-containing (seleno)protein n=1 Tax=unclassified Myroides TaxID=2642485 RepID=UPI003D2F779A
MLFSTLTCPNCQHQEREEMPVTAFQFFYVCKSCQPLLKPLAGNCCVFYNYGNIKCPPIQRSNSCCSS